MIWCHKAPPPEALLDTAEKRTFRHSVRPSRNSQLPWYKAPSGCLEHGPHGYRSQGYLDTDAEAEAVAVAVADT
eukprot:scaffold291071_cov10-Prasinocladus_malaysianus.AAC.1